MERKRQEKEKHKKRCLAGMAAKGKGAGTQRRGGERMEEDDYDDDDAEWYRQEVGEEPEDMMMG